VLFNFAPAPSQERIAYVVAIAVRSFMKAYAKNRAELRSLTNGLPHGPDVCTRRRRRESRQEGGPVLYSKDKG
jgi:hypothetical protein